VTRVARARCREEAYLEIERLAAQSGPGAGGVLYVAAVAGERFPLRDDLARACFLGVHPGTTRADLHRAVPPPPALAASLSRWRPRPGGPGTPEAHRFAPWARSRHFCPACASSQGPLHPSTLLFPIQASERNSSERSPR
jgi:hypothetical protein